VNPRRPVSAATTLLFASPVGFGQIDPFARNSDTASMKMFCCDCCDETTPDHPCEMLEEAS
jgi:hypothetical protein